MCVISSTDTTLMLQFQLKIKFQVCFPKWDTSTALQHMFKNSSPIPSQAAWLQTSSASALVSITAQILKSQRKVLILVLYLKSSGTIGGDNLTPIPAQLWGWGVRVCFCYMQVFILLKTAQINHHCCSRQSPFSLCQSKSIKKGRRN